MEPTNQDLRIEQYLMGKLTDQERVTFEQEIATNKELAAEVQLQKTMLEQIDLINTQKMRAKLQEIKQEVMPTIASNESAEPTEPVIRPRRRGMRRWYQIAAAAMIVLAVGTYVWQSNSSPFPEALYLSYYEPYPISFNNRAGTPDRTLSQADAFYNSKMYAEALPLLESLANVPYENSKVRLATGICQLEANRYRDAIKTLKPLIEEKDALFLDQAQWYTVLASLQTHQLDFAEKLLQEMVQNPRHYFLDKAKKLLADM